MPDPELRGRRCHFSKVIRRTVGAMASRYPTISHRSVAGPRGAIPALGRRRGLHPAIRIDAVRAGTATANQCADRHSLSVSFSVYLLRNTPNAILDRGETFRCSLDTDGTSFRLTLADALHRRADWPWACDGGATVTLSCVQLGTAGLGVARYRWGLSSRYRMAEVAPQ